ncbi:hypothetical protein GUJ14_05405 [Enterococcus hirae]|uniref:hypothetical protein n=1 Tax=Enterococcus hirae TaxID=1354 RepID=UPI000BA0B1FD|nr:hypothetical protein [Enterococcus hirae]HCU82470.1 hypothetical protein [Enterococcus sp.]ASV80977.1 hypothetical protein A6J73_01865 [Enterococcus hirae]MDD9144892.1 hypothetical protein [Enterococcus hirae]MEB5734337.1 hypothetical protein [Enterococcus hirae]NAA12010.1 hypothetical protein [Enterococcus hirae]
MTKPLFEKTKNQENMGKEQLMSTVDSLEVKLRENLEPLENVHKCTELYIELKNELKREIEERAKKREDWYKKKHSQIKKKEDCEQELQNAVKAKKNALYKSTKRVHGETIKSKKKELNEIAKEIKNCKSEIKKLTKEMQYLTGRRGEKWIDHSLLKYVVNTKVVADEKNTPEDDKLKEEAATEKNIAAKEKVTTKELKLVTKELTEKQRKQQLKNNLHNLKELDQTLKKLGNVKNSCFNQNKIDYYVIIRLYLKRSMQLEKIIRFRINPGGKTLNLFSGGKVDKKRKKIERDLQMSWRDIYSYLLTNPDNFKRETAVQEKQQGKKQLTDLISKELGKVCETSSPEIGKGMGIIKPSAPPMMPGMEL